MHYQNELFSPDFYQRSGYSPIYDPAWDDTDPTLEQPKTVLEQVTPDTSKPAPEQNSHWIEEYSPSNRKHLKYFRYCYMVGRKIKHIHIRGGNVNTPLAIYRKIDIEDLIASGESPDKIVKIINQHFK